VDPEKNRPLAAPFCSDAQIAWDPRTALDLGQGKMRPIVQGLSL